MTIDKEANRGRGAALSSGLTRHRDTVTLTSCVIFAATIAEMVNAENIGRGEKLADVAQRIARLRCRVPGRRY